MATASAPATTQEPSITNEEIEHARSLRKENYAVGIAELVVGAVLKGAVFFGYNFKGSQTSTVVSQMALQVNGDPVTAKGITYALISGSGSNQAILDITCANGQETQVPFNLGSLGPQTVQACGQEITWDPTKYYSATQILNGKLTNTITQAIIAHPEWTKVAFPIAVILFAAGAITIVANYVRGKTLEERFLRTGQWAVPPSGASGTQAASAQSPTTVAPIQPVAAQPATSPSTPAPSLQSTTASSPPAATAAQAPRIRRNQSRKPKPPIVNIHIHSDGRTSVEPGENGSIHVITHPPESESAR